MRRTIRVAGRTAALLVGTTLGACAPLLSHGPRVQEGTTVGASAAVFRSGSSDPVTALIPYLTSAERHEDGTATQFTLQLVIPAETRFFEGTNDSYLHGMQLDYYRELVSDDPAMARGRGIHVALGQIMPYGMWGIYSDRLGIYTTQGIGAVGPYFGLPPEALFWSPGAGLEYEGDAFTVRAQVSTMALWRLEAGAWAREMPVSLGVTLQLGGRDPTPKEPVCPCKGDAR